MAKYQDYGYASTDQSCAHKYLLPAIESLIGAPGGPVLDLGCGNGALANELLRQGHDVFGVDASESGIAIASSRWPDRFFRCDLTQEQLPPALASKRFSVIISTEVIEHLYSPRSIIRLARANMMPTGRLILSTPYHGYLKNVVLASIGKMDDHFTALWDGGHIKFFSRKTLMALLASEGFATTRFIGAGRVPYLWRSMVLEAVLLRAAS